jgi:pilus assembly protein CpaB
VLALVIATGGSVFLYKWLQMKTAPKAEVQKVEAEVVNVVVAVVDLPWGTKLQKDMLKTVPFLKESLPKGYESDLAKLEGRVVISPLKATETVLESRLAPESVTTGGVSAVIKPGMRAVAVKGDKVIGISGHLVALYRDGPHARLDYRGNTTRGHAFGCQPGFQHCLGRLER